METHLDTADTNENDATGEAKINILNRRIQSVIISIRSRHCKSTTRGTENCKLKNQK